MTDRIEDGGPAYPHSFRDAEGHPLMHQAGGMTLRDHFAGRALANSAICDGNFVQNAKWAYQMADAMIAARKEGPAHG